LNLRSLAVLYNVPYITTISGASAAVNGIEFLQRGEIEVKALQDYHPWYKKQNTHEQVSSHLLTDES
jgi:carbamoyl-phosphate synthase large subunit